MTMTKRFPMLLHVTFETDANDDENGGWFQVQPGGVFDVDEPGKAIALYRLVQTGTVGINKKFLVKHVVDPALKPKRKKKT
jgi:hypothetical protein